MYSDQLTFFKNKFFRGTHLLTPRTTAQPTLSRCNCFFFVLKKCSLQRGQIILDSRTIEKVFATVRLRVSYIWFMYATSLLISFILSILPTKTLTLICRFRTCLRSLFHLLTHTYICTYSHNSHCLIPVRDTHVPVLPVFSPRSSFHPALPPSRCSHVLRQQAGCSSLPSCRFSSTTQTSKTR